MTCKPTESPRNDGQSKHAAARAPPPPCLELDTHVDAPAGATLTPQQIYLTWDQLSGGTWAQL